MSDESRVDVEVPEPRTMSDPAEDHVEGPVGKEFPSVFLACVATVLRVVPPQREDASICWKHPHLVMVLTGPWCC